MTNTFLGTASIEPQKAAVAGRYGTWMITITVGTAGIDSGGQIKIARRLVSDWGTPQFADPQAAEYTTIGIQTAGSAKIRASWQPRGYIRPKSQAIVLDVYDGSLDPGDKVIVTLGDTSQGSPGSRAQTYIESEFEFFVLVDPTNSTDPRPIADRITLPIVADTIVDLACILPSQALVGEPIEIFVKGEDQWRNPVQAPSDCTFRWVGSTEQVTFTDQQQLIVHEPTTGFLEVIAGSRVCRSNPIRIYEEQPHANRYWGDLHAQTSETVGVGSEDEYFTFGRDWARLDFMSHQGNDFQMDNAFWDHLNRTTARYNREGAFVVFPGYEWSGSSPTGGDHNVFYRHEGLPIMRSSHWLIPHVPSSDLSPAHPADVFYEKMKRSVSLNEVIVAQHVGGRYANLRHFFDQDLISLVEVVSVWGVFEWMIWDAFEKGYVIGIMGNSDGHHGRPGAEGAGMTEFGIRNGLTCVLAPENSRAAIFDALKQRRCYATTGERIMLDFSINGQPMGSILQTDTATIRVEAAVTGTSMLESLQLYQGANLIAEVKPDAFHSLSNSNHIRISWQGCRERGRQRRVTWDGSVSAIGCEIISASPFSFDVIADGIVAQTDQQIDFRSKTTGDRDGLDIILADASQGTLRFDSAAGQFDIDLATLTDEMPRVTFDFGGVDMQVIVERYPSAVLTETLSLSREVTLPSGKQTPYFVKATQVDGHMGWASPIYITGS